MGPVKGKTIRRPKFCAPIRTVPENVLIGVHIVSISLINIHMYMYINKGYGDNVFPYYP